MYAALAAAGIPLAGCYLMDEFYAAPQRDWITEDFAREFSRLQQQMGFRYEVERRDCDKYALWAHAWASEFHALTPGAPECGLAFGEAACRSFRHAFNVAVHVVPDAPVSASGGKQLEVVAYEPQPGPAGFAFAVLPLKPEDWRSIYLCKF